MAIEAAGVFVDIYSLPKLATIDNSELDLHLALNSAPAAATAPLSAPVPALPESQAIDLMRCQRLAKSASNGVVRQLAGPERERESRGGGVAAKALLQSHKICGCVSCLAFALN